MTMRVLLLAIAGLILAACGSEPTDPPVENAPAPVTELAEPTEVNVEIDATDEVCGGFTGILCPSGYYCKQEEGQCLEELDGAGTCQPVPQMCTQDYTPVCGCDGQTYSNACQAGVAGISVAIEGECVTFEE